MAGETGTPQDPDYSKIDQDGELTLQDMLNNYFHAMLQEGNSREEVLNAIRGQYPDFLPYQISDK